MKLTSEVREELLREWSADRDRLQFSALRAKMACGNASCYT
jgi:hypothetical protein